MSDEDAERLPVPVGVGADEASWLALMMGEFDALDLMGRVAEKEQVAVVGFGFTHGFAVDDRAVGQGFQCFQKASVEGVVMIDLLQADDVGIGFAYEFEHAVGIFTAIAADAAVNVVAEDAHYFRNFFTPTVSPIRASRPRASRAHVCQLGSV